MITDVERDPQVGAGSGKPAPGVLGQRVLAVVGVPDGDGQSPQPRLVAEAGAAFRQEEQRAVGQRGVVQAQRRQWSQAPQEAREPGP